MTNENELRISYDELTRLIWKCSGCGAEQGIDMSCEGQAKNLYPENKIFNCGVCGQSYDSRLVKAFRSLFAFYDEINKYCKKNEIFFRISVKNKEEESKI